MKFFCLLFIIFLLFCNSAFAEVYEHPATLEVIVKTIPEPGNIKCKFKQEKSLQNLEKPLVSGGEFEFIKNKGVVFHTTYPINSTVDYTNKNYKQINDIVNAISTKKYSKLEKDFNFYYANEAENWILGMKPKKNSAANDYITAITISGSDIIKRINILQTNGNETTIWFTK